MRIKRIGVGILFTAGLLLLLSACGDTGATPPPPQPTVQSGTVAASTPGTAPIVVLTPTPEQGGAVSKQTIRLADRTLTLQQVSQQPGVDASSRGVSITITITNTSAASIQNKSTFYQLVGAEGDAFGSQSSVTSGFYGPIPVRQNRSGTITFQVPIGAAASLQLLYRPEIATETVLVPLNK